MNSTELSEKISHILLDKKAKDVDIIKIEKLTILTDYFILCTGTSTTHIRTLADEVITNDARVAIEYEKQCRFEEALAANERQ